jgi:hypothetical protein
MLKKTCLAAALALSATAAIAGGPPRHGGPGWHEWRGRDFGRGWHGPHWNNRPGVRHGWYRWHGGWYQHCGWRWHSRFGRVWRCF